MVQVSKSMNEITKLIDKSKYSIRYVLKKCNNEETIANKHSYNRPKKWHQWQHSLKKKFIQNYAKNY